jgi:hypothetical protein
MDALGQIALDLHSTLYGRPPYLHEAFEVAGEWYRLGKLGPYRIVGPEDTSGVQMAYAVPCRSCCPGLHSRLLHYQHVLRERKEAICHPSRYAVAV